MVQKKSYLSWKRLVFSLVGFSGLYALIWMFTHLKTFFVSMSLFAAIAFILLMVGGLNWGVVAITGDARKDLLYCLGL